MKKLRESVRGLSAERIALILAVGLVLGTFPIVGFPTLLCAAAAVCFRVNLPALQAVNQLSSPLQWLLLLPLQRVGWSIFGPPFPTAPHALRLIFDAVGGWLCICVPLGCVLYVAALFFLRRRKAVAISG